MIMNMAAAIFHRWTTVRTLCVTSPRDIFLQVNSVNAEYVLSGEEKNLNGLIEAIHYVRDETDKTVQNFSTFSCSNTLP
jgi:hypothetical protein